MELEVAQRAEVAEVATAAPQTMALEDPAELVAMGAWRAEVDQALRTHLVPEVLAAMGDQAVTVATADTGPK